MTNRSKYLYALARGLRGGASKPTVIEEGLYRAFVVNFCYSINELPLGRGQVADANIELDEIIHDIIKDAYCAAMIAAGA